MTRKEQQQAQQRQRPHDQDQGRYGDQYPDQQRDQEGWNRSHGALTGTTDVHSYVSITQAKSDVDLTPVDRYPSEGGCGLPAYEVVTKQDRRVPTKGKAAVEDMSIARGDKGAAGEICEMGTVSKGDVGKKGNVGDVGKGDAGAIALQPNRRMATGDIELGGVLSVSEVELLRARSRREHAVSSLVYHWRSPIGASVFDCGHGGMLIAGCALRFFAFFLCACACGLGRDWAADGRVVAATGWTLRSDAVVLIVMMAFGGTDVDSYASRCTSFSCKDDRFVFGGGCRAFPTGRA